MPEYALFKLHESHGNSYRLYAEIYEDPHGGPLSQRSGLHRRSFERTWHGGQAGRRDGFHRGINHMAWLLDVRDKDGNDLYPEIRKRALEKNASEKHNDMIRYEYIRNLGYYCTESSEHNSEYNPFYIKSRYPELIDRYNIPLDEYPRRCIKQIADWEEEKKNILNDGKVTHERSREYASYIMEAVVTNKPYPRSAETC